MQILNAFLLLMARKVPLEIFVIDTFEMTAIWNGNSRGLRKVSIIILIAIMIDIVECVGG